ncbi:hypothetical protein DFP74_3822 [Nocardiopsis sp. Huas11]|uniref:hypothetical protein n=1 Tax=Nocardiopsis sp. Huas11 TaxID=2183912 RepID=UPI000EB10D18|nr:hypothetical protein [Nocardiopsis sp. Huas11]RKS08129.1 hypothetical protein DFP74_3822 [Nocardiopsis sp. Huas11]
MDQQTPGPLDQGELIQELGQALVSATPEGWQQLTYLARVIGALNDDMLAVQGADGQVGQVPVPDGARAAAEALKQRCYQEGKGTWLSMIVSVHHTGKVNIEYNYDTEPELTREPSPLAYAQELERYPREDGVLPDWIRAKLDQARTLDTGAMTRAIGAALVAACSREGLVAEHRPPTGLRVALPDGSVLLDTDMRTTFDQALIMPEDQWEGLAAHFAGYVAQVAREREAAPAASSGASVPPAPSGQSVPVDPADTVATALAAAFRELGVEVSFQDPNTMIVPMPNGNTASADIGSFRTAMDGAAPEQVTEHATGFARNVAEQLERATRQGTEPAGELRVRLYPASAFPEGVLEQLVSREIAPGLWQTVVVDSPESLQPLSRQAHESSGRSDAEVFAAAVSASLADPVEVTEHDINGTRLVHIGGQHPYVAAHVHDLARHVGEAPHGALVVLPVPEVVIAHPLGQAHPVAAMENLREVAQRFAADAEKPISTQLYWWHPSSRTREQSAPADLRPVGVEIDHEKGSITLHTSDQEFGPLLSSLMGQ